MEKVTESINSKFILLNDFYDSFKKMDFSSKVSLQELDKEIITPFRLQISKIIPNLKVYELEFIRQQIKKKIDKRYYVITMDDGTYFQNYDYNFNISRTAYKLEHIRSGPYFRIPRNNDRNIISQGQHLYDSYIKNGNQKPIVLCDDGVGTGKSVEKILNILNQLKMDIAKIFVLLNPNLINSICNNDIETIIPIDTDFAWLSERDLFWGLPRSGVTCSISNEKDNIVTGIPYTIDIDMVVSRIANFGITNNLFRRTCIEYNIKFWTYIENKTTTQIYIYQIPRLQGLGLILGIGKMRIVNYLQSVMHDNFKF